MSRVLAVACAILIASSLSHAQTVSGTVFEDIDGDGKRQQSEPGVPGVRVSNGIDVTVTDGEGRYRLALPQEGHVFVVKPRGYQTRTDSLNIPRYYATHKPGGSRDDGFVHKGVAPTGLAPRAIDFALTRTETDEHSYKALLLADPQPYTIEEVRFYRDDVLDGMIGTDASFAITLGDIVGDDLDLFEPLNRAQAQVGIPWYTVFGNHDMNFMSENDLDSDETFERVYGPTTYAFQYGRAHFLVFDNVIWNGFDGHNSNGKPKTGNYVGGLRDDHFEFLANYVRTVPRDDLIVLAMHIPADGFDHHHVPRWRKVLEILSGHRRTVSFSGHMHTQTHSFFGSEDGYNAGGAEHHHHNVGTASGSWWRGTLDEEGIPHALMQDGTPNGYAVLEVTGNRYRVGYRSARRPANEQMRIIAPESVEAGRDEPTEVLVNVYNGSSKCTVRMRVGQHPWAEMRREVREDPTVQRLHEREKAMGDLVRPMRPARPSSHIWVGHLPDGLPMGTHTIEVETTDQFGIRFRDARMITVR